MKAAILIAVLSLAPWPAMAAGALHHTLTEKTNFVSGTSAAEIYRDMLRHPIVDPDSGRSFANLTHEHELEFATEPTGLQCRVTRLDFTWHFVMTLPSARDENRLPAKTRELWRSFVSRLRSHELYHRDLFVGCGQSFVPEAATMTAPQCSRLERGVRRFIDTAYDACMEKQRAFDRADTGNVLSHPFIQLAKRN
jgi:predicted secreted Zn-dependent protease